MVIQLNSFYNSFGSGIAIDDDQFLKNLLKSLYFIIDFLLSFD